MSRFEELQKLILINGKGRELQFLTLLASAIEKEEISISENVILLQDLIYFKKFLNK
jgi:hypothetical protein